MLSSPKDGWCIFTLHDFVGHPSYITDVVEDTFAAFIDYYEKGLGIVNYDEEGTEFLLVLNNGRVHIIYTDEYDRSTFYDYPDTDINDLCDEFIKDVERETEAWVKFSPYKKPEYSNTKIINANLIYLKELRKAVLEEE